VKREESEVFSALIFSLAPTLLSERKERRDERDEQRPERATYLSTG